MNPPPGSGRAACESAPGPSRAGAAAGMRAGALRQPDPAAHGRSCPRLPLRVNLAEPSRTSVRIKRPCSLLIPWSSSRLALDELSGSLHFGGAEENRREPASGPAAGPARAPGGSAAVPPDPAVGHGRGDHHLLEQAVEEQAAVGRGAAVEAEGELVQVPIELGGRGRALVGGRAASRPGPARQPAGGSGAGARSVGSPARPGPPRLQAGRPDQRARLHHPAHEGGQTPPAPRSRCMRTRPGAPPRSSRATARQQGPARRPGRAAPGTGAVPISTRPSKAGPARADHGPPEPVQHRPGRLVAAQVQRAGQVAGRHPCSAVATSQAAANHRRSGVRVPWNSVPAVTVVWWPQPPADQALARSSPRRPSAWPQAGQRNPWGQLSRSR